MDFERIFKTMKDTILFGDCKETLSEFAPQSARTCVTSPPYYGLRDYGGEDNQIGQEQTPDEFIDQLVNVFKEVKNVLTDLAWKFARSKHTLRPNANPPTS